MGNGGVVIIDDQFVEVLESHAQFVAPFRLQRMTAVIEAYERNHTITDDDAVFLLRCADDVVDNQASQ
jgi:hypothetical protein